MSELSNKSSIRVKNLTVFSRKMIEGENGAELYKEYQSKLSSVIPHDIIMAFDNIVLENIPMDKIKVGVNKILNILYKTIQEYPAIPLVKDNILHALSTDSAEMESKLKAIRPLIKTINKTKHNRAAISDLKKKIVELTLFDNHYVIKENILFPLIEKSWTDYRCLQIMWSFHDDIRRNLKTLLQILDEDELPLKQFNRLLGDIFFNMLNIKFRDENILFPKISETIDNDELISALAEGIEIGFPYIDNKKYLKVTAKKTHQTQQSKVDIKTGFPTVDQIRMVFNHLPVDLTYVDENDEVVFYTAPKHRVFPRTNAIIGRKVHNCHPPESVEIVEQIVHSFRIGERNEAKFWIQMKGRFILIQYFAVRDEDGKYKGVVEVSQDVTDIRSLEGEQRLLDWE